MKLKKWDHLFCSFSIIPLSSVFMPSPVFSVTSVANLFLFFHLNFNDPIEISARMIPRIQNRTMTFDSGHPICSKW